MDKKLSGVLDDLVNKATEEIKTLPNKPKRVVLFCSQDIKSPTLILNYTENAFLNRPVMLQNNIPITKMNYRYRKERHGKEGDYCIDLYTYLKQFNFKDSAFWA